MIKNQINLFMKYSIIQYTPRFNTTNVVVSNIGLNAFKNTQPDQSKSKIQKIENTSISNGLFIPEEGTSEFSKWISQLDQEIEKINAHNQKSHLDDSSSKENKD